MIPYIVVIGIIVLCCFLEVASINDIDKSIGRSKRYKRKILTLICFITLWLFGVLRSEMMGVDTYGYRVYYFEMANQYTWKKIFTHFDSDIGFYAVSKAITLITNDYWMYRSIIYTIILILFFISFYKKSKYVSLAAFLYCTTSVWFCSLYIFRQALATAIVLLGYLYFCRENKTKKYIISVVFAALFHKTAILALIALMVNKLRLYRGEKGKQKNTIMLVVCTVGLMMVMPYLMSIYTIDYSNSTEVGGRNLFILILVFTVFLTWIILRRRNKYDNEEQIQHMLCTYSYTVVVQACAMFFALFTRTKTYFIDIISVLIPEWISSYSELKLRMQWLVLILIFFSVYFFALMVKPEYLVCW